MNRKSLRPQSVKPSRAQWWATPAAFMVTLLALPANAVNIPNDPLASGVRVAPNILFILDDSGSMNDPNMPDSVPTVKATADNTVHTDCDNNTNSTNVTYLACSAYTRNTIYYNPSVDYEPWTDASGSVLSGGTSYIDVYDDAQDVDYTGVNDAGTTTSITNSAQANLSTGLRTFYVPKATVDTTNAYLGARGNYYRFQIPVGAAKMWRSGDYSTVSVATSSVTPSSGATSGSTAVSSTTNAVAAGNSLEITINNSSSGPGTRSLNYAVKDPSAATVCSGTAGEASSVICTASLTSAGAYTITVQRSGDTASDRTYTLSARTSTSCDGIFSGSSWKNCTENTPDVPAIIAASGNRTLDDEKINYATWYSYWRTRIKAAKGGAADAFSNPALGNKVRVGYTSIWNTNPFYIPVGDLNDGRFVNNDGFNGNPTTKSRSKWYSHLFAAGGTQTTPLQSALNRAGQYYSDTLSGSTGAAGPYGPETGTAVYSCRQNFTILTTDGYWNNSVVSTGTAGDGAAATAITNGLPASDPKYKTFTYTAPAPYKDSYSNTLADVAMKYWKTDLMTGLTNNVPSSYPSNAIGEDPAFWQHMVTFGISIGLKTTNGLTSVSQVTAATTWPDPDTAHPTADNPARIDDLLHAAVNGRGSFVSASNPQEFSDGLAAALAKINEVTSAFSNASASDSTQVAAGSKIFKASYRSGRWTGVLTAISAVDGTKQWATTDAGKIPAYGSRNIYTRSGTMTGGVGGNGIGGGTTFPDTSNQLPLLLRTGGPANYAVTATDNAEYIKGRQTNEGATLGKLRIRSTVLGDIVDSSPAYVSDTDTVYIGANDGMMHAFNAETGVELFAYVPNIINFGKLAELSRGDYEHRWFVDGPIAISTRSVGPSNTNILVGSLGRGGKGLYALDVTNPSTFSASNVKWERNETAGNNMGLVLGTPVLAQVRNGASTSAVVFGNGPNSTNGKAVLVVLSLADGSVIREIPTDNTVNNGLFAPTGVYAADGKTLIYAYAGDLQGNLWKFNMTSSAPNDWTATKIFHAEKTTGTPQPITSGVAVAVDPRSNKRWVFFSTGSFMTDADANDKSAGAQSMYGVMDDGASYTRGNLTARTVTTSGGNRSFQDLATLSNKGWYVDLPGIGERIVQNAQIDGAFLITASMLPSGNSCDTAQGSGYINAISVFDGIATGKSYFDLDGNGSTDDTGTGGQPTGSVLTNGMPTLPLLMPGQVRGITSASENNDYNFTKGRPTWNRVSWRELRKD